MNHCPRIENILPQSLGEKHNIKNGEILRSINGHTLRDIIDYQYLTANEKLSLEIEDLEGNSRIIKLQKNFDDDLGIVFESAVFDGIRSCKNKCIFCFVDQMPKGHRKTLYVKDDDYRLSFLYGNYITLTNLSEEDYCRIEKDRLSPLYISIHCADEKTRKEILGTKKEAAIIDKLKRLTKSGIQIHGQIVLAPTYNDGKVLEDTIEKIYSLGDEVLSLALVPVGLTKCQKNHLRTYSKDEAKEIIKTAKKWQAKFLEERYSSFLFVADEFYLLADEEIPDDDFYEDYPQIENGVGIIRQFYDMFDDEYKRFNKDLKIEKNIVIITGKDGATALQPKIKQLKNQGINIELLPVTNKFFGETVTVTGLLTGKDIIDAIKNHLGSNKVFLIPDILLKHNSKLLLDDTTIKQIEEETKEAIMLTSTDAAALLDTINQIGRE